MTDSPEPHALKVFVSYAHEDQVRAASVVRALEQAGCRVWWDRQIVAGAAFATATEQALEAAAAVVVLWSKHASVSHWVRDEATRGRDRGCLVPVTVDGTEPPLGFRQYLVIDLSKWHGRPEAPEIRAVIQAVQATQAGAAASAPPVVLTGARGTTRRQLLLGAGGAALIAAGGAGWLGWQRRNGVAQAGNGIAVLPFANLSGDPAQGYFADGLAAEVRSALARDARLRVIAQVSSDAFRDQHAGAVKIADALGVSYLLDGNVRRAGQTFRIATELIDGRSGFSRWSQTFDRPIDDIFAVQSEIAHSVLAAMPALLAPAGGAAGDAAGRPAAPSAGGTTDVTAFDAYLRGRQAYIQSEDEASDRRALAEFDAAIAADPNFAAAHAARSRSLIVIANQYADATQTTALYDAAVRAAETATMLAPNLAQAQSALGFARQQGKLDFKGARRPYDLSRQLGTGDSTVMGLYALYCAETRRAAEAAPAMARAVALDPLNPLVHMAMGSVLYMARRHGEALAPFRKALALNPKLSNAHARGGMALLQLGRGNEARDEFNREPHDLLRLTGLAVAEHTLGHAEAARAARTRLVTDLGDRALYQQAQVAAQWGEAAEAMALLARALALGDSGLCYANTDPLLDPLRALPAFGALLRQLGFD
jgi:TolB-like protein